jgi:hypothetical protein
MGSGVQKVPNCGKVDFVLMETAGNLDGQDLLRIVEIAEQARAEIHISFGPWQVLAGVPENSQWLVKNSLEDLGYWCFYKVDGFIELHTIGQGKTARRPVDSQPPDFGNRPACPCPSPARAGGGWRAAGRSQECVGFFTYE